MPSITDIVDIVQSQRESGLVRGRIDLPVVGATIYGERLELEGWVVGDSSPARAVEAVIDGKVVQRAPPGISRPDIDAARPDCPRGGEPGFLLTLGIPRAAVYDLHVRAVLADESRHSLAVIRGRHRTRDVPALTPLVSVVIPCHNQARFIEDAIGSVFAQSYEDFEVVVVDDGSVDESAEIVERLGIRCLRQQRKGPSAARNTGFYATTGDYVVFLDGDNRLDQHALAANLHAFEDHPESAFVGGRYAYIDEFGARERGRTLPDPATPEDHYAALLAQNYFGSPDNVMFRRSVLDDVGVFDSSVDGLEDYDLYLRIAKDRPVYYHGVTISEYRVHASQFSRDKAMMLRSAVRVLRRHRRLARSDATLRDAYSKGLAHWRGAYSKVLMNELRTAVRRRHWSQALKLSGSLLRWHPAGLVTQLPGFRQRQPGRQT
jgi:glycosyltransferase involved in cell wall biosynthesis